MFDLAICLTFLNCLDVIMFEKNYSLQKESKLRCKISYYLCILVATFLITSLMVPSILIYLMQREGKPLPEASLPFHRAMPSMTHMALVELEKAGILKFVISQVGHCSTLV